MMAVNANTASFGQLNAAYYEQRPEHGPGAGTLDDGRTYLHVPLTSERTVVP